MQSSTYTAPLPPNLARILYPPITKSLSITIPGSEPDSEEDYSDSSSPCDCSACRTPSSLNGTTFLPSSPGRTPGPGWFGGGYSRLAPAAKEGGYTPVCFEGGDDEYDTATGYDTVVDEWVSTLSPVAEEEMPRIERVVAFSPRVERAVAVQEERAAAVEDGDESEDGDGLLGTPGEKTGVWGRLVGRLRRR